MSSVEDMSIMGLVTRLEMYALNSPDPDNLLDTQKGALEVSTELKRRVEDLYNLADRMNANNKKKTKDKEAKETKGTHNLEEEDKELELRNKEKGRIPPNTGRS